MTRPAARSQRHRAPPRGARVVSVYDEEPYVRGVIEFLDKRWTHAEADLHSARRSVLLLFAVAVGCSVLVMSLAVAIAGFFIVMLLVQDFVDVHVHSAAMALSIAGGAGAAMVLQLVGRRREPPA